MNKHIKKWKATYLDSYSYSNSLLLYSDEKEKLLYNSKKDKKFILNEEGFVMEWRRFLEDVYKVVKEYLDKENIIEDA